MYNGKDKSVTSYRNKGGIGPMDREGKRRTEYETMKDDTEGTRLEIGGMELLPESSRPLGGSSSPKNPSWRWIDGHCNAAYHGSEGSLRTKDG